MIPDTAKLVAIKPDYYPTTPRNVAAYAVIKEFTHPGYSTAASMEKVLGDAGISNTRGHIRYLTNMGVLKWE